MNQHKRWSPAMSAAVLLTCGMMSGNTGRRAAAAPAPANLLPVDSGAGGGPASRLLDTVTFGDTCSGAKTSKAAHVVDYDKLNGQDTTWQFSVPMGHDPLRRAYLWIPPNCKQVRGVIIGVQNMLEQMMFQDVTIRKACADSDLAIVWITPGDDAGDRDAPWHRFTDPPVIIAGVQKMLTDLAAESGYAEIASAPLLATAHSAATPFVWGIDYFFDPARMIAVFPVKGWFTGHLKPGIPVFHTGSEYGEVGGVNWGETYRKDRVALMKLRSESEDDMLGEFVDIGAGHFEWNPKAAPIIAMFIRKVVAARVPASTPPGSPMVLRPIDPKSGVLIDPTKLGTPEGQPVPYAKWQRDPKQAFWYIDREMAQASNDYMVAAFAKKPQVIDFVDAAGALLPLVNGGNPNLPMTLLPDGVTLKVAAVPLDKSPTVNLYNGESVGHANGPILFKASSGAITQTGPDTFRVSMKRGGLVQQGNPWDPWVIAYQPGDSEYRSADRPGHLPLTTINKAGAPQTITFAPILKQTVKAKPIKLQATSDSGLPVQFYVVSGPVELTDDSTLKLLPIPPSSKFPVRVIVGAYQWGRIVGDARVQTAGPVFQEFTVER